MRKLFLLTVIATVVLTACNNDNNTKKEVEEEKFTILFGKENYKDISRCGNIFITGEANGDFIIEKAEDVESGNVTLAEKDGKEI